MKKICVALCLSLFSFTAAFAGERAGMLPDDTANVEHTEIAPARLLKDRPVDATGLRLAVLPDAVLLRWKFENVRNLSLAILEQSSEGMPFKAVSILAPDAKAYTDATIRPDCRYRIRMVANDGTVVLSSVVDADGGTLRTASSR